MWWHRQKVGNVERWQFKKGGGWGGVVRSHNMKDVRVVNWRGGRFPVLLKGGGRKVRRRFHIFVSDANQRNEGA